MPQEDILTFGISVCGIGTKSERQGIERLGALFGAPEKGMPKLIDYRRQLEGKPSLFKNIRLDHWETMAADLASAMICKVFYDNLYGRYVAGGNSVFNQVSIRNNTLADILLDELKKAEAVQDTGKTIKVNMKHFVKYIFSLAKWKPSEMVMSSGIMTGKSVVKVNLQKMCEYYGEPYKNGRHPGTKLWLEGIVTAIMDEHTKEVEQACSLLATGLIIVLEGTKPPKKDTPAAASSTQSATVSSHPASSAVGTTAQKESEANTVVSDNMGEEDTVDEADSFVLRNQYIIVSRDRDEVIRIKKTDAFYTACAMQIAMLTGRDVKELIPVVKEKKEDLKEVAMNLLTTGRDRIANDTQEVYILLVRGRKQFR